MPPVVKIESAVIALHKASHGIRYGTVSLTCEFDSGHFETYQTKRRETFCGTDSIGRSFDGKIPPVTIQKLRKWVADFSGSLELVLSIRDGLLQYYEVIRSPIPVTGA
jgi:hypothetical protein